MEFNFIGGVQSELKIMHTQARARTQINLHVNKPFHLFDATRPRLFILKLHEFRGFGSFEYPLYVCVCEYISKRHL